MIILLSLTLIGAMYAGIAQVLVMFVPGVPVGAWVVILTLVTLAVLLKGSYQRAFVVALTVIPCLVFFATGESVQMVKVGGVVLGFMLPVLAFSVVYLRHRKLPPELAPGGATTVLLWLVAFLMLVTMTAFVLMQLGVIKS